MTTVEQEIDEIDCNLLCDPCLFDDAKVHAEGFCVQCVEYVCAICSRQHAKTKCTRSHTILTDSDLPRNKALFRLMNDLTTCPSHMNSTVSHRCGDHNAYVCNVCIANHHRACVDVKELSTISLHDCKPKAELVLNQFKVLYKATELIRSRKLAHADTIQAQSLQIENERMKLVRTLNDKISKLNEKLAEDIKKVFEREMTELHNEYARLTEMQTQVARTRQLVQISFKYTESHFPIVMTKLAKQKNLNDNFERNDHNGNINMRLIINPSSRNLPSLGNIEVIEKNSPFETNIKNSSELSENVVYTCENEDTAIQDGTINESVKDVLITDKIITTSTEADIRKNNLESLNPIKELIAGNYNDKETADCHTMQPTLDPSSLSVSGMEKQARTIRCVKTSSDTKTCSVVALNIFSDGKLVIIDKSNRKIKVFDNSPTLCCEYKLQGTPIDMCIVKKDIMFVIFSDIPRIYRYSFKESIIKNDKAGFRTKYQSLSITGFDNKLAILVQLANNSKQLELREHSGQIIDIRDLTANCIKLLANKRNTTVHLYFLTKEKIECCCMQQGNHLNKLQKKWAFQLASDKRLIDVFAVNVDQDGNVYMLGMVSNNIDQQEHLTHKPKYGSTFFNISAHKMDQERTVHILGLTSDNVNNDDHVASVSTRPCSIFRNSKNRELIIGCMEGNDICLYEY